MPFLTQTEENLVVQAIKDAELNTSGELRVHIEERCSKDINERMKEVFLQLKMNETEARNGILIYLATKDRKVGIWGDQAIHQKVGQSFWDDEIALIIEHFKKNEKAEGLSKAIQIVGNKLKEHFPYQSDDINELDDSISYGKKSGETDT
jgi:uncharacterized membrane protein